ncbi:hypothetical protein BX600DRAFT_443106 [Xylariales sp. PMI_506]|nr:hypothetical protein BX600DRAFT_443106 [Xylariales sp. PMI_506]
MANSDFCIVIVGGGIAGLTSAIALRGPGRSITVLEQSRELREIGAALSLQPNASKILEDKWGLRTSLRGKHHGAVDEGFRIFNAQGGALVRQIPFSRDTFGSDRVVYHRVDLLGALKEAATSTELPGSPAVLKLASRVVSCDCKAGTVTLEDGTVHTGDLVVAADGIHSALRKYVTSEEIDAVPTGTSAYRIITPMEAVESIEEIKQYFNPTDPWTTLIMGYDRRIIMGPCREGKMLSIVALVPDEHMHEKSDNSSWTSQGSLEHLLESFAEFPEWVRRIFKAAPSLGLWQLRDLDPLSTWTRGRVILIGDAAHAMLPTMGQGASQSVEDAEALQSYLADITGRPTGELVAQRLREVFQCRYDRVSLIQAYSRQQAGRATTQDGKTVTLNPLQFEEYTCRYEGAKDWELKAAKAKDVATAA